MSLVDEFIVAHAATVLFSDNSKNSGAHCAACVEAHVADSRIRMDTPYLFVRYADSSGFREVRLHEPGTCTAAERIVKYHH